MYHRAVIPRFNGFSATFLLRCAAASMVLSLLWDYSWESTVGIDLAWSPPHVATYLAVVVAAMSALVIARRARSIGALVVLWGALAFVTAVLFDRWWQSAYGLAAGIWHPPQILKAAAFFAIVLGAWWVAPFRALAAANVLALIHVVALPVTFANRQHGAAFFEIACGACPLVMVACTTGVRPFAALRAALGYMLLVGAMVWLLPVFPASPMTGPIFNPRDHLLPPPFPLLLVGPALVLDWMLRGRPAPLRRFEELSRAAEAGLAFFVIFVAVQWVFAGFLLSPAADNWFFAGGGRHWPFFLEIHPSAKSAFWPKKDAEFTLGRALIALGLAMFSSLLGLWFGRIISVARK